MITILNNVYKMIAKKNYTYPFQIPLPTVPSLLY